MECGVSRARPGRSVLLFVLCILAVVVCGVLFSAQQAQAESLVVDTDSDVTDSGDDLITLREAMAQTNGNSEDDTITLVFGQLAATNGRTVIDGSGAVTITTSAGSRYRLFEVVNSGTILTLRGLTLTEGSAVNDFGGAHFAGTGAQAARR